MPDGSTRLFRVAGTPPDDPPPTGTPKARLYGIGGRSRARTTAELDLVKAGPGGFTVIDFQWRALQPNRGAFDAAKAASLLNDVRWAADQGLNVHLRQMCGIYAPDWALADAGSLTPWYSRDNASRTWLPLPRGPMRWTHPKAHAAYRDLQLRLVDLLGGEPNVAVTTAAEMTTEFAEPCIKQYAYPGNVATARAAGVTTALDVEAFERTFATHAAVWSPAGVATSCAYNTHQGLSLTGSGMDSSPARTLALMDKQHAILGKFTVWANNSLLDPDTEDPQVYTKMASSPPDVWKHFQTETTAKHRDAWRPGAKTSPARTFEKAITLGAHSVEFPSGGFDQMVVDGVTYWPAFTMAQAASFNTRFRAVV